MQENKLAPYQRLKTIIKGEDVIMTEKSLKNLDDLLGESKNESMFSKFINYLKELDRKIFTNQSKMYSNKYRSRK
jgi:hypothetical protein